MELEKIEEDRNRLKGKDTLTFAAGTQLQIRYRPAGEEVETILSETVPAGKRWEITIRLGGYEYDA